MQESGITEVEMEKSGCLHISKDELRLFYGGQVSERLKENWGFTLKQLAEVIDNNNYEII